MSIKFVGEHIAKLDDKGRLVFPSQLKALAESTGADKLRFVVRPASFRHCLEMLTYEEWVKESERVLGAINIYDEEGDAIWQFYTNNNAIVEPDEKTGRIQIPKNMLDMIDVRKEVVFVGRYYKIEVTAKEFYPAKALSTEEGIKLLNQKMSKSV